MNDNDFLDRMFFDRSDVFPPRPQESQFHMTVNGRIYIFLEGRWSEVEDMKIDYIDESPRLDSHWEAILEQTKLDRLL